MLREVVGVKYRRSESMYDTMFQMRMGLKNIHIS